MAPGPVAPPQGTSIATLSVRSFDVRPEGLFDGWYWYRPSLVLIETSGKSTATLQSITFTLPDLEVTVLGSGCFLGPASDVVPAGGSWSLDSVYVYCLDLASRSELSGLQARFRAEYRDEEGRDGAVTGTATVGQPR